ncbi:MAG: hypothetical protein H6819_01145 [Phycisphaerales bacterium]|nr:hypothetical protein [Phycisphaerales bacterium]MCB9857186.1 hypothetical protein [Phycisphaerales bacterium]MCB9863101.1 hypothetical protein [Phycisphaerales bacterium]
MTDQNGNNVPDPCDEELSGDADGNLLEDADFKYQWSGANRLVQVKIKGVNKAVVRVTCRDNYIGRRVQYSGSTNDGRCALATDMQYFYDAIRSTRARS